jgi:hypothetical protein
MTISTDTRINTDGWTFGPIGAVMRPGVRSMAFRHGVTLTEDRGLLSSMFRAHGTLRAVDAMRAECQDVARRLEAEDHAMFVDEMEKAEKRRARWHRLIGRRVRRDDLALEETHRFAALMASAKIAAKGDEDAIRRLTRSITRLRETLRIGSELRGMEGAASTVASMGMRYLQHDLRNGNIRLPDMLKLRIMQVVPTVDTWDEDD